MTPSTPSINPKRIGYLRMAPASGETPVEPDTPAIKAMWVKLSREGLLVCHNATEYSRTEAGDKALADFDRTLSEPGRLVLNAVKAGQSGAAVMKGMLAVINAGLVEVLEIAPYYVLTDAGRALADPIGEEGYFRKSGNLVRVHSLCTDSGVKGMLDVERLEGDSAGKRLLIPRDAFVRKSDWESIVA